jgi:hypothetical protein
MTFKKIDSRITQLVLGASAILLVYVALYSSKHYADSESVNHYFIVESVFSNPKMALDHWGKPLFIALSSLFSLFGQRGVMVFNVIIMLLTALIGGKLAKKLGAQFGFLVPVLILFAPVYYPFAQSCLTEPLFGFVAVLSAYLFSVKKYTFSTIVISFILFSRSEGILFIPIYAVAMAIKRQWRTLPFLLTGFISYGVLGVILGKGFLWYYFDYPYSAIVSFYGKGPFWNWFTNHQSITGSPFSVLIVFSFFALVIWTLFHFKKSFQSKNLVLIYLVTVPAAIYIFGHSFLWYKGWSASVGLPRIVGGVIPLIAVFTTVGFSWLISKTGFYHKKIELLMAVLFSTWMIANTFEGKKSVILSQPNEMNQLIYDSIDWLTEQGFPKNDESIVVYKTDYLLHYGVNPKKEEESFLRTNIHRREDPENELKSGDIIVWDGQTTPNEGGISFEVLATNPMFEELITFRPKNEFKVLGGGYYFITIFRRK